MILLIKITGHALQMTLPMCLLFAPMLGVQFHEEKLIYTICVATQWAAAFKWKASLIPNSEIIDRIDTIMLMERIFHTLQDNLFLFTAKWDAWSTNRL